jgi:hypothetical protein
MPLPLIVYAQPSGLVALALGILLITTGVQMKRASVLSLGIFAVLFPMIFLSLFAAGWGGASEKQLQVASAVSSSVIVTIAFLITRRF